MHTIKAQGKIGPLFNAAGRKRPLQHERAFPQDWDMGQRVLKLAELGLLTDRVVRLEKPLRGFEGGPREVFFSKLFPLDALKRGVTHTFEIAECAPEEGVFLPVVVGLAKPELE